jgi:ribulose-5-phosphate 4-epimerase/fuculose-1-phosphate aldolase
MLLPDLRKAVLDADLDLLRKGLALDTSGNASAISRKKSLVVTKPSGVPYRRLRPADLARNAVILESVARMAHFTFGVSQRFAPIGRFLHDQHYLRKHGKAAFYGQPKEKK